MPVVDVAETYPALLSAVAAAGPDRVFLHCASERTDRDAVTFAELRRRARRVAAGLLARGLRPGDRVAVAAPNCAEWVELFLGAASIGVAVVTLNMRYRELELEYMLNQSDARLLVTSAVAGDVDLETFYAAFRSRIPTVEHVLFLGGTGNGERYRDLPIEPPDPDELDRLARAVRASDPLAIIYTSGTTGTPKGAVHTHASMLGTSAAYARRLDVGPDDVAFTPLPLNHVFGIGGGLTSGLLTRSALALAPTFSPAGALDEIERHRATLFAGVPTMYTLLLGHDSFAGRHTGSVRVAVIGAANADPTLCAAIAKGFPNARLVNAYGLTEAGGCVLSAPDDDLATVSRTLGIPLDGTRVRVVDPDGNDVGPGEDGELLLQGPGNAAGYWRLPEDTAEVFLPGGWVATGDIVTADPDGHLTIRGRRKEMFIQGGYNVYPIEVENVLTAHPTVAMAAGIGVPDPILGEVGHYVVLARPGRRIDTEELTAYCAARLADYKVPRHLEVVDELPLTPSGKVAKAALRERLAAS